MAAPERPFSSIDRLFGDLAGVALFAIMILTVVSTTGRYLFSMPIPDVEAIAEMLLVAVVLLPMAYAQVMRDHVEVTLFTESTGYRTRLWLERLGCLIGVLAFGFLTYAMALGAHRGFVTGDAYLGINQIPTWPARAVGALGAAALTLRLLLDLFTIRPVMGVTPVPETVLNSDEQN